MVCAVEIIGWGVPGYGILVIFISIHNSSHKNGKYYVVKSCEECQNSIPRNTPIGVILSQNMVPVVIDSSTLKKTLGVMMKRRGREGCLLKINEKKKKGDKNGERVMLTTTNSKRKNKNPFF